MYAFARSKTGWRNEHQTAVLPAGSAHTRVGWAVGVSANTIVATSDQNPTDGPGAASASYVYRRPAGGWHAVKPIASLSMSGSRAHTGGTSVAINPTTIAVGDSLAGRVDVYARPSGGGRSMRPTATLISALIPRAINSDRRSRSTATRSLPARRSGVDTRATGRARSTCSRGRQAAGAADIRPRP